MPLLPLTRRPAGPCRARLPQTVFAVSLAIAWNCWFLRVLRPRDSFWLDLGKGEDFNAASAERLAATIVGRLLVGGEETLTFAIDRPKKSPLSEAEMAAHLAFGAIMRSYRFDHYRSLKDDERPTIKRVVISTAKPGDARKFWAGLSPLADGIFLARDLVNEPANVLHPDEFSRRALELKKLGVSVEVLDVPAMQELEMNALLGVAQGSANESRLVVMHWDGRRGGKAKNGEAPMVFVGKGVCFDSGRFVAETCQFHDRNERRYGRRRGGRSVLCMHSQRAKSVRKSWA